LRRFSTWVTSLRVIALRCRTSCFRIDIFEPETAD
jgi:hypothetical protein